MPWTDKEIEAVNLYQELGWGHPYTCRVVHEGTRFAGSDGSPHRAIMVATREGMMCPECGKIQEDITPNWHASKLPRYREIQARMKELNADPR